MAHQEHTPGFMEADGHAHLLEDEVALEVIAWRRESSGAAGDDDHVGTEDFLGSKKLVRGRADALVETAKHGGIGDIGVGRRIEVKDFLHKKNYQLPAIQHSA